MPQPINIVATLPANMPFELVHDATGARRICHWTRDGFLVSAGRKTELKRKDLPEDWRIGTEFLSLAPRAVWNAKRHLAFSKIIDRTFAPMAKCSPKYHQGYCNVLHFCQEMLGIHNTAIWHCSMQSK